MAKEQRWQRVHPLLPDLVAAARVGLGREVLEHFMCQIYNWDGKLNAVVESCAPPANISSGTASASLRPLEGLPFLVKDNLDVKSFHTVCGSALYVTNPAAVHDCSIVANLRELGAVPIGKTNMPSLGWDVQTFNDIFGTTCNPYNAQLTAGGSSGGSAAAVALGLAAFSVGTDWNGSLRLPAAFCGVCSLRASRGRMSLDGRDYTLPKMPKDPEVVGHILVTGVFTKTVEDLRLCTGPLLPIPLESGSHSSLKVLCEVDEESTTQREAHCTKIQSAMLDQNIITVGVALPFSGLPLDHRIEAAMRKIPLWLGRSHPGVGARKVGAVIIEDFSLDLKQIHAAMKVFSMGLASMDTLESKEHLTKLEWAKSVQVKSSDAVDAFLKNAGYSALIIPVCTILPPKHNYKHAPVHVNGVKIPYWMAMCSYVEPFSVSGNPVVTMPLCIIEGKPCGMQVIGKMGDDENLLNTCVELERLLHVTHNS